MTDAATATTSTVTGEAFGAARGAEQLGIVGILTLVIIGLATALVLTLRAHTAQGLVFAEELGKWLSVASTAATRARKAEQRVAALDERIDRMADRAPVSRRGEDR